MTISNLNVEDHVQISFTLLISVFSTDRKSFDIEPYFYNIFVCWVGCPIKKLVL